MRDTIIGLVDKTLAGAAVEVEIARLASLSRVEYDRQRKEEAKKLGIKLATLDREVADLRAQQKPARNFLPHWNVEPWPEEVDGAALLDDLRQQFTRYVVIPAHADVALALWTAHTWVFECFDVTPYLSITSPTKRCGKTVLMTLLYWLSCRGKKTDSMSKPAIYRSVDREKPTLVLDEVGWVLDLKDDRQGILCGGFERNGYAEVCEGKGTAITTRLFSTYCPKAFGLVGKLIATLTDRSICIPMRRKLRREKVERLRRRDNDEFAKLRQQCLRWANDNAAALAKAPPPADERLNDRALDFWEPLFIIADLAGDEWPKAAREAALALSGDGEDDSTNITLLRDVHWLFVGKLEPQEDGTAKGEYPPPEKLFSKTIAEELNKIATSPWAGWHNGRGFQQADLARELKAFGVAPETVRIGKETAKGYYAAKLASAFETYLLAAPILSSRPDLDFSAVTPSQPNNDGHNLRKSQPSHPRDVTAEKTQRNPRQLGIVTGVTAPEGENGAAKNSDSLTDDPGYIPEFLCRSPGKPTPTGPDTNCAHTQPANEGDLGLPRHDLVRLANSYKERSDAQRNGGAEVDQEELDAGLRQVLAEMVLPEDVEIEFARVMEIVCQPED
jgi:putative DNA primase/helicase